MATRSSSSLVGIALAVVIVVAVVVGIWRSVAGGAPDQQVGAPVPPAVSSTPPYEHHEDESGAAEETTGPPPTNAPSTGTDADEDSKLSAKDQAVFSSGRRLSGRHSRSEIRPNATRRWPP